MATSEDTRFHQAVCVHGHRAGDVRNIGGAREAMEWLLQEWPDAAVNSLTVEAARQACQDALEGGCDTADARRAFRAAVVEAGILIGDVDRMR